MQHSLILRRAGPISNPQMLLLLSLTQRHLDSVTLFAAEWLGAPFLLRDPGSDLGATGAPAFAPAARKAPYVLDSGRAFVHLVGKRKHITNDKDRSERIPENIGEQTV